MKSKYLLISFAVLALASIAYSRIDYGPRKETAIISDKSPVAISNSADTAVTPEKQKGLVPVLRVIDGDTIVAEIGGQPVHVRLIGINSPELNDKRAAVACLARKAKEEAQKILDGTSVYLEKDATQGDYDKYNRLLAYVFAADGVNFNKLMIEEGYAYEYTYNLPYKYQKDFKYAQNKARGNQLGLWSSGLCASN